MKYYSLDRILKRNADYNIIFGERSNGKTYAMLRKFITDYAAGKGQFAYIRRWREDVIGKRGSQIFSALEMNGEIERLTKGEWTRIKYYNGAFYFARFDENTQRMVSDNTPCGYAFSLSEQEHDKSVSYPNVTNVGFDEFLTRRIYLNDEFVLFMNVLSTIIRDRSNVKIFMLGNTVNKFCPYFSEMGLRHVREMEQGSIDVYNYGNSGLTVAVEYAPSMEHQKKSNKFFAFDNENLKMITQGKWELALYPHLPHRYKRADVVLTYYIEFQDEILAADIVCDDSGYFTFIHRKTTPIRKPEQQIIFSDRHFTGRNYYRRLLHPCDKLSAKIGSFYATEKVFFQDNNCGEIVRNYIKETEGSQFAR